MPPFEISSDFVLLMFIFSSKRPLVMILLRVVPDVASDLSGDGFFFLMTTSPFSCCNWSGALRWLFSRTGWIFWSPLGLLPFVILIFLIILFLMVTWWSWPWWSWCWSDSLGLFLVVLEIEVGEVEEVWDFSFESSFWMIKHQLQTS